MTVEWGHRGASVAMTSPSTIAAKLEEPWSVGCSAGRFGWVIMAVMIRGVSREEVPAMGDVQGANGRTTKCARASYSCRAAVLVTSLNLKM